jgi:hypothetical protein
MRLKKSMRVKKSAPRVKKSPFVKGAIGTQAIFLVVLGVAAAAAMLIASAGSSRPDVAAVGAQQERSTHATARKSAASGAVDATLVADVTTVSMPAVEPPVPAAGQQLTSVTITGCLEQADESYRLKDTTGVEAAKSRSWRSGFLKKRSASIEVVDASNRLQLPTHVGQRVSVTGLIVDREMQGRSLKRIAASCAIEPVQGSGLKTIASREP